jgi:hypothetical protein
MLTLPTYMRGSDPEGFFVQMGRIVGSERVIPAEGLGYSSKVVQDGVQYELNPQAGLTFREHAGYIAYCFDQARIAVAKRPGIQFCWNTLVEVERDELDQLSLKARELGCQPSDNIYGTRPITVNVKEYRKRSAGGHMHFGLIGGTHIYDARLEDERKKLILLLDQFVGNTGVLFDRAEGAVERRENYGRAGEFRTQPHGVEYRTLSNFWLKHYTLASLMWGMADIAVAALEASIVGEIDFFTSIQENIDQAKVVRAIDQNDPVLAWNNLKDLMWLIKDYVPANAGFTVHSGNILKVMDLADEVQDLGIDWVFKENRVWHWVSKKFEDFR